MDENIINKQDFNKITRKMELWQKIRDMLGNDRKHLYDAMMLMSKDNSIDFSKLWYSYSFIRKLRLRLQNKWAVKKLKLQNDRVYRRYINPLLQNYGRIINIELIRQFSETNKELWYRWDTKTQTFKSIK